MLKNKSDPPTLSSCAMMATTATLLTAKVPGAVAVIALHGPEAINAMEQLCHISPAARGHYTPGRILRTDFFQADQIFDNGLIVIRSATFVELHLHGGPAVVNNAMMALAALGVKTSAGPMGDIAPENPEYADQPLLTREVMDQLCHVQGDAALDLLAGQISGGLTHWVITWGNNLAGGESEPGAMQRLLWQLNMQAQWILDQFAWAGSFLRPPKIAIIGPPNAGKSTLLNALAGRPTSITSHIAGTTRDWVEANIFLGTGEMRIAANVVDTAGVRITDDPLEVLSIERTYQQLARADLLLVLLDQSSEPSPHAKADVELILNDTGITKPVILVATKCDLPPRWDLSVELPNFSCVKTSATQLMGLEDLTTAIFRAIGINRFVPSQTIPFPCTDRQRDILSSLMRATSLKDSRELLTRLLGVEQTAINRY